MKKFDNFAEMARYLETECGYDPRTAGTAVKIAEAIGPSDFGGSARESWQRAYETVVAPHAVRKLATTRLAALRAAREWWNRCLREARDSAVKAEVSRAPVAASHACLSAILDFMRYRRIETIDIVKAVAAFDALGKAALKMEDMEDSE